MALHLLRCAVCGQAFHAARRDAVTCSKRCRSRRERTRRRRREATTAQEIAQAAALLRALRTVAETQPAD